MLSKLRSIFMMEVSAYKMLAEDELLLAAAVLLIEVARADHADHGAEYETLTQHVKDRFNLIGTAAQEVIAEAIKTADDLVSLHEYVEQINIYYSPEQKVELLRAMWEVAFADGELHHYEEHLIRRLADLLYIPHRDFIRTKHLAYGS